MIRTSALVQGIHVRLFFWTKYYFHLFFYHFQETALYFSMGTESTISQQQQQMGALQLCTGADGMGQSTSHVLFYMFVLVGGFLFVCF